MRKAKALKVKSRLQVQPGGGARGRKTPLTGDRHRATRAAHTGPTFDLATSHMPGRRGLSNNHPTRPYGLTSTTVGESVIDTLYRRFTLIMPYDVSSGGSTQPLAVESIIIARRKNITFLLSFFCLALVVLVFCVSFF